MKLGTLLRSAGLALPDRAAAGVEVTQIEHDSRRVQPGSVFVAVPGFRTDGHAHAAEAVRRGAVCVVAERSPEPPLEVLVPLVIVPGSRVAMASLAAAFHRFPSRRLTVAGITGTDGKTTTTTMLWAAWRAAGRHAAAVSTVDVRVDDEVRRNTSRMTTMEAPEVQRQLAELVAARCTHVALETSSHALELHRVDGVDYALALYTRISSEHLDLHGSWEAYLAAKRRLLTLTGAHPGSVAVLDADDERAYPILVQEPVTRRLSYSITGKAKADLVALRLDVDANGVHFVASTPWGSTDVDLQLAGRFNAGNALAAIGAACATGVALDDAVRGVGGLHSVPGRMERVDAGQEFAVVVDYAHTANALEKVLSELRPATRGRLWVVFGSAGERDREKRPEMGRVAAEHADMLVVTDEDPRGEDRQRILEEIAAGAEAAGAVRGQTMHLIADRTEAIRTAFAAAAPGDTVLLAGKGHESSIEMAEGARPWDERSVAESLLREGGR
jgi:UDP-N-acetylmuramoyl-L-alanyl-D-glutamate--2,6-diaminopimelate ligase